MSLETREALCKLLTAALKSVAPQCANEPVQLERPRQSEHGDFSSNLAMQLARNLKKNPRELATALIDKLPPSELIAATSVAGAGFINFTLTPAARLANIHTALHKGEAFGRGSASGERIMVEFVSANPTGPLHVGHGRGAAYGASLANLLEFAGHNVAREYYVNDAGRQMDILAVSLWLRYLALFEVDLPFPPNAYCGQYVIAMAHSLRAQRGDQLVVCDAQTLAEKLPELPADERNDPEADELREHYLDALIASAKSLLEKEYAAMHRFALDTQLADCQDDLAGFGVSFDAWFSEQSLFDTLLVEQAVQKLEENGHLYEQNGAKWFRSTTFGDEKDRVVQRENGLYTYFASDIAYHLNKLERGFDRLINVWGADHHGYIPRVKGALTACGAEAGRLDIALVQFAALYRQGQKLPMSTRAGQFVTLRELREEVGRDACRFFYVLRKGDQHLDFDIDLATSESAENPVYYIQYAHARICSVMAQYDGELAALATAPLTALQHPRELALANRLDAFGEMVQSAALDYAPHQIAFYLKDLAADFHGWYNAERILVEDNDLCHARLALAAATRVVLASGLAILGVSAPQAM